MLGVGGSSSETCKEINMKKLTPSIGSVTWLRKGVVHGSIQDNTAHTKPIKIQNDEMGGGIQ